MSFGWHGAGDLNSQHGGYGTQMQSQLTAPLQTQMPPQMGVPQVSSTMRGMPTQMNGQMMAPSLPSGPATTSSKLPQQISGINNSADQVCNVWKRNLSYHMAMLRYFVPSFNFVTIDVKFPGIIGRPIGTFHSTAEFHYQTLRSNIDLVEPLQLGLTLTDAQGNVPPGSQHIGTWQFNFKFNAETAMCSTEGIEVLRQSGLDINRHKNEGIELADFFEALTTSGLLMNPQVTWITFYSGYDLGLLVAQLLNCPVPNEKDDYMDLVKRLFPEVWDVKMLVKAFNLSSKNNLHEIGEDFQLFRATSWTSAGSDSRLTALCFYEILRSLGDAVFSVKNRLFGLEEDLQFASEEEGQHTGYHSQQTQQSQSQQPPQQSQIGAFMNAPLKSGQQHHGQHPGQVGNQTNQLAGQLPQIGSLNQSQLPQMQLMNQNPMGMQLGMGQSGQGGPPGLGPNAAVPPVMPMPYMFTPGNPPVGNRQAVYYSPRREVGSRVMNSGIREPMSYPLDSQTKSNRPEHMASSSMSSLPQFSGTRPREEKPYRRRRWSLNSVTSEPDLSSAYQGQPMHGSYLPPPNSVPSMVGSHTPIGWENRQPAFKWAQIYVPEGYQGQVALVPLVPTPAHPYLYYREREQYPNNPYFDSLPNKRNSFENLTRPWSPSNQSYTDHFASMHIQSPDEFEPKKSKRPLSMPIYLPPSHAPPSSHSQTPGHNLSESGPVFTREPLISHDMNRFSVTQPSVDESYSTKIEEANEKRNVLRRVQYRILKLFGRRRANQFKYGSANISPKDYDFSHRNLALIPERPIPSEINRVQPSQASSENSRVYSKSKISLPPATKSREENRKPLNRKPSSFDTSESLNSLSVPLVGRPLSIQTQPHDGMRLNHPEELDEDDEEISDYEN